jgi:hypothetical protein
MSEQALHSVGRRLNADFNLLSARGGVRGARWLCTLRAAARPLVSTSYRCFAANDYWSMRVPAGTRLRAV